jgi:hypothetical protein
MPYTAQFFAEKLNVPVEYFNPFRSVQIDPGVNLEELSRVAHSLGEVVGLGLRNLANCPVELNLMPDSTLRWQTFNEKKPYFIATLASLALMALAVGFLFNQLADVKKAKLADLEPKLNQARNKDRQFQQAYRGLERELQAANQYSDWLRERAQWAEIFRELRAALVRVEEGAQREFGVDAGVWVEKVASYTPQVTGVGGLGGFGTPFGADNPYAMSPEMDMARARYGEGYRPRIVEEDVYRQPVAEGDPAVEGEGSTNQVGTIKLECRGVSLSAANPSANNKIAFALQAELAASPLIDAANTTLDANIYEDETTGTFSFGITLALKHPLKP